MSELQRPEQAASGSSAGFLPPLPVDRQAAEAVVLLTSGADSYTQSPNTAIDNDSLLLQPGAGEIAWGIWRLSPGEDSIEQVELNVTAEPGVQYYAAVANYVAGRWVLSGPFAESMVIALSDSNNRSPGGNCFVAVMTSDGDSLLVNQVLLTVNRTGWQHVTLEEFEPEKLVDGLDIAVIGGRPAIVYHLYNTLAGPGSLKYTRSSTATGASASDWPDAVAIDSGFDDSPSLAEVEGHPAVSYGDRDLIYVRSSTTDGMASADWGNKISVNPTAPRYTSLAIIDGHPAIAFNDNSTSHNLMYAWSSTSRGDNESDWADIVHVNIYLDEVSARNIDLLEVGGSPAITYFDSDLNEVWYARATSSNGIWKAHWYRRSWSLDELGVTQAHAYNSQVVAGGNPAVFYYDEAGGNLRFMRALNAAGGTKSSWGTLTVIDTVGEWGKFCSAAEVLGAPAVCFYDTAGYLVYARSSTEHGEGTESWTLTETVDELGSAAFGAFCALAEVDSRPAVVYFNRVENSVKYAILFQ